jgi:dihydroxyacetone kinase-like predicted kinase
MSILYLNGENIYQCFASGAREVIKNKKSLNSINVFPVADGDTGSNLASTMNYIIEEAKVMESAKNTMSSIADAALVGARGNSGIIMAQYINGIFMSLTDDEEISITGFAESVKKAVSHAYNAISNPVEGTIITVIRDWADAVYSHKDEAKNFYELLRQPLDIAFISLKKTTSMMLILEKSKIVDSGAKGFVHFLQGFTEFLKTGKTQELLLVEDNEILINDHLAHNLSEINYRFCTEALISKKDNNIDIEDLKSQLKDLGDSLIIAGNYNKARIHIHTNYPQELLKILRKKSNILFQKADDMKRQYQAVYEKKYNIALVTDSIADLPKKILDKYQVHVVPLNLVIENSSYLDNVTMTPDTLYELIDELEEYPSSAQPSPKFVENLNSFLLNYYDKIIVITVAKEQSGTNNVFLKEAEKFVNKGKKIEVIDSKQNSGAEGLLVLKAAELIENGRSFDNVVNEINELRE